MQSTYTAQSGNTSVTENADKPESMDPVDYLNSIHDSLCTLSGKLNQLNNLVKKHFLETGVPPDNSDF